jgi:putative acetyltransferase
MTERIGGGLDGDEVHTWVAEVDGRVVGTAGLHRDWGRADLFMWVLRDHRGTGIGTALLDATLAWARADPDVFKVTLQHWPHNVAAHALYRRAGFVQEGYLHAHWRRADGSLWDAVVMGLGVGT